MSDKPFKALVVTEKPGNIFERAVVERRVGDLPAHEVLIRVHYSSLNYKDALSAKGHKGITRHYPHTPGIDAAGIVEESKHRDFKPGDEVLVTGYDLGMNTPGGFGQYIRVPGEWVVKKPAALSLKETMVIGTAGFTAALGLHKLVQNGLTPGKGEILVTGASGGVGSLCVALFSKLEYPVVASTGKPGAREFLTGLGAREVIGRAEADDQGGKPLLKQRWAAVFDTVGGNTLSTALKSLKDGGSVAACGNVSSVELNSTVFPFILRDANLLGVASAGTARPLRLLLWEKLAGEWKIDFPPGLHREVPLRNLDPEIDLILKGGQKGRVVVNMDKL